MKESPFDTVAESYEMHVAPIFHITAQDLIELVDLEPGEKVLDVGTGPGVAAMLIAPSVTPSGSVVAVDLSEEMLTIAREKADQKGLEIEFRRANIEDLDFPDDSFDVVLSSFGLGTTEPGKSLPSIRRVLKPGGRFGLSQWGPSSRPAHTFFELLQSRRVDEPPPRLEWLRKNDLTSQQWYLRYNTREALEELLVSHGFKKVRTEVRTYKFSYKDADAYIDMSLSFPLAQAEFEALSPGNQRMFRHEFNIAMAPYRGPNRSIISEDTILFAVTD